MPHTINGNINSAVWLEYSTNGGTSYTRLPTAFPAGTSITTDLLPIDVDLDIRLVAVCDESLVSNVYTTSTTTAAPAFTPVYVNNNSSSGYVIIYDVQVDGITLALDYGNFPLTAGQNLLGQVFNLSTTASVFISFTTPIDCAVTVIDTYGTLQCVTSPGNETITVDLSGPNTLYIYVGEQGSLCF